MGRKTDQVHPDPAGQGRDRSATHRDVQPLRGHGAKVCGDLHRLHGTGEADGALAGLVRHPEDERDPPE